MPARQDEVMVVRTLAFMIARQVLCLVGLGPSPDAKDVEIAVLRHQLMVLRRPFDLDHVGTKIGKSYGVGCQYSAKPVTWHSISHSDRPASST
jgi:hypothetical protein